MMSSLQNVILAKHHTKRLSPKPQKYWRSKIIAVLFCNAKYFRLSAKWIFKERIMTIYGTLCDRETKLIIHWPDKWQYKTPWGILMDFYRLPRGYLFINSIDTQFWFKTVSMEIVKRKCRLLSEWRFSNSFPFLIVLMDANWIMWS